MHSPFPPPPWLPGWVLSLLLPDPNSLLHGLARSTHKHWVLHPGQQGSLVGSKRSSFCLQWACGHRKNSCQVCALQHLWIRQGSACPCHGLAMPQTFDRWVSGDLLLTPIQVPRASLQRGCSPLGDDLMGSGDWIPVMGPLIFNFHVPCPFRGLCQLCSRPWSKSRPEWLQSLCFLQCPTRLGISTAQCESEVRGLQSASHQKFWQEPGRRTTLHQLPGEHPPFLLPKQQFLSYLHCLPPSLCPHETVLFYCAEVSLSFYTPLQRNHASGNRWVMLVETDLRGFWKVSNAQ